MLKNKRNPNPIHTNKKIKNKQTNKEPVNQTNHNNVNKKSRTTNSTVATIQYYITLVERKNYKILLKYINVFLKNKIKMDCNAHKLKIPHNHTRHDFTLHIHRQICTYTDQ